MKFKDRLFSAKPSYFTYGILFCLFCINDYIFRNKKLESILWNLIKLELYYIGGKCQNSGKCCQNLMLIQNHCVVDSKEKYELLLKEDPAYNQFKPEWSLDGRIKCFHCLYLQKNYLCANYENRPQFCRNYPMSSFFQFDCIHKDCGYYLAKRDIKFVFSSKVLSDRIKKVDMLNGL